jgi:mono/diheme cytochrome c family protein
MGSPCARAAIEEALAIVFEPLKGRARTAAVLVVVLAFVGPAALALAAATPPTSQAKPRITQKIYEDGRKLYRKYCGQCHALKAARAVGFGQNKPNSEPGPSLDSLRVSWNLSVQAIVLAISGHETISQKMTWKEISDVSAFVEKATKTHPIPAKITGADFTPVLGGR